MQGITGHELCHYFWDPSVRMEWEITLETSNVVSWLARDTHITYQALKRIWPTAQRDSLFWSTIRHCPSDDEDGPDYWIVVNHTTDCMPVSQVCVHCVPKNVHFLIFWITLSKISQLCRFLVCGILRKFHMKIWQICPLYLSYVTTLPWRIQKSHFQQYYSYTLLIIYVISVENKLVCLPTAPENVTTLTCEKQNFFVWLKVCCVLSNVGGSEESQLWVVVGGSEKNRLCCGATGMSGKSQQVFRMTIFCINTCFQSFSIMISLIVHHAVLNVQPMSQRSLPQHVHINALLL